MTLSLQLIDVPEGETPARRDYHFAQELVRIGRHFESDLCLAGEGGTISRTHVSILQTGRARYRVTETSTNGTRLNGAPLAAGVTTLLSDGDVLEIGGYRILVGIVGAAAEERAPSARPIAFEAESDLAATGPLLDTPAEPEAMPQERCFTIDEGDESPLLFDPFADRETMRRNAPEIPAPPPPRRGAEHAAFGLSARAMARARPDGLRDGATLAPPEHMRRALERTVARFVGEIDPSALEVEYRDYVGSWRRGSRYWTIHKKQFAKRAGNGEFGRTFMAYFLEEMRK